jgi:hypothetical protein
LKRPSIRLLNAGNSKVFNRYITVTERDRLLFSKPPQIKRISTRRAKFETYQLIQQPIAVRDMNEASPPSITNREMRVFAGIEDGNRKRVRAKVKAHESFRWRVKIEKEIDEQGIVFDA